MLNGKKHKLFSNDVNVDERILTRNAGHFCPSNEISEEIMRHLIVLLTFKINKHEKIC